MHQEQPETGYSTREKKLSRQYLLELGGALAVYTLLLVASITFGRPMEDSLLRILILLSPMAGFSLGIWAIARHFRRRDEFERQNILESIVIAAAITAGLTFTYGFLETAGYPRLSMFAVWPVMCVLSGVTLCVRSLMHR
jgi:predicted permease